MTSPRRRFLRLMGLGTAASPLVLGMGDLLIKRALGAPSTRRLGIFFGLGEAMILQQPYGLLPPELIPAGEGLRKFTPIDTKTFTWPAIFAPLAPYKDRMVIVDGVDPQLHKNLTNHGYLFALFSCMGGPNTPDMNAPIAITIDQFVAQNQKDKPPVDSLLFGSQPNSTDTSTSTFAAGPNRALSHAGKPSTLLAKLVGKNAASSVPGGADNDALVEKRVLDLVRDDVKRLQGGLAGEERALLDEYLATVNRFDETQKGLRASLANCKVDAAPADPAVSDPIARMQYNFQVAGMALKCGLTNVVGISVGNSFNHDDLSNYSSTYIGKMLGPYGGHNDKTNYSPWMKEIYTVHMKMVADLFADLGPLLGNTVFITVPANGTSLDQAGGHHGEGYRVPATIFDGTGTFKTGGRYLRFKKDGYVDSKGRHLADVYTSVAHALGAPVARFNDLGTGPMEELMA